MRIFPGSLLLAALVASGSGCSFVAVRRPPSAPSEAPLECTRSRVAPGLDTAGAVVTPLLGVATWGLCEYGNAMQSWASEPRRLDCGAVLWAALIGTAAYTGSAVYGFHETGECRRLSAERDVRPPVVPSR